jgi:hypothetical protein
LIRDRDDGPGVHFERLKNSRSISRQLSVVTYKKLREAADDPVEQTFYGMLETMEREHRLSLENTYEYFKDPVSWFQCMEKHGLDGA